MNGSPLLRSAGKNSDDELLAFAFGSAWENSGDELLAFAFGSAKKVSLRGGFAAVAIYMR